VSSDGTTALVGSNAGATVFEGSANTGPATKLAFTTDPPATSGEGSDFDVAVSVEDSSSNVVNSSDASVALSLSGGTAGAMLTCTPANTEDATSGTASFSCSVNDAGDDYTLTAMSSGLTSAVSSDFDITSSSTAASQLAFTPEPPASSGAGANFDVAVSVEDSDSNLVSSSDASVALSLSGGTAGATLTCTPANTEDATSGVASFSCSVNDAGDGYTLTAMSSGLTSAVSSDFDITTAAGGEGGGGGGRALGDHYRGSRPHGHGRGRLPAGVP
jgi:phage terminase large subunit-like protein